MKKTIYFVIIFITGCVCGQNQTDQFASTRAFIGDMVNTFMARQNPAGSQVVSLNITNLFILVILKALIYAAGHLGAGAWKGRSDDGNGWQLPSVSETELLLYLGYLTGAPGHYECLQQTACKDPRTSTEYLNGAKLILNTAKTFSSPQSNVRNYEEMLSNVKEAIQHGRNGHNCELLYNCAAKS